MDLGANRAKQGPSPSLREVVERYLALAGGFGRAMELRAFGWSREETEKLFGAFDEDYHISRFFHFSLDTTAGERYSINSFPQSHVWLDAEIETIL